MQSTQTEVREYSYFAGNQWRKAENNRVFEVHEPYSGKLFAVSHQHRALMLAPPWTRRLKRSQAGPKPHQQRELACS